MGIELLGSRKRRANIGKGLGTFVGGEEIVEIFLQFEASVSEIHTGAAEITSFPVEEGADQTDHIRRTPDEIEITGIVSNDPILVLASLRKEASTPGGDPDSRAEDAFEELRRIKDEGELLTVFTTLKEYKNMAITNISVPRDRDLGNVMEATVSMREIVVASSEIVAAPEPAVAPRSQETKKGRQNTTTAKPPVANDSSLAIQLFGG